MNAKENEILEYINTEGFVSVTKDTPKNEQDFVRKLKAFGVLVSPKNNYQFNPSSVFYKHFDSLLVWEGKIEDYQFEDKSVSPIVNNFKGNTITQFNQNSNQNSLEQMNNSIFIKALNQELSKEQIIRKEAKDFFENRISNSARVHAVEIFHELKSRLYDFYSAESKSIFLDEIEIELIAELNEHRKHSHQGEKGINCSYEDKADSLLYYIKQEIGTLPIIAHQKFKDKSEKKRNKVFISYSHLDKEYLTDIQRHFKPFLNQIDFWDDTKIQPGQKWKNEIRNAINETKVAILLLSTDFLGSDFITSNELPPLLESAEKDGTVILIVILKPCLFEEFNELNQFQAMNPPNHPISKMDDNEKEELFVNLVRQTKRVLNEITE
nr:toll/interleukin-1 receptor domain-containing protein [uncultured Flavobacterium sp.]